MPQVWKYTFIPLFYSFLYKSGIFPFPLMKIIDNRNISRYLQVRSSCSFFRKQLYLAPSVLPELWVEIPGARLHAMSHIGVLAAPQHLHHPTRSARPIRNSFLSCIPSPGTAPALGVEGMQSCAWSLCLHRLKWARSVKSGSGSASPVPGTPQHLHPALWAGTSPCLGLIQRCL